MLFCVNTTVSHSINKLLYVYVSMGNVFQAERTRDRATSILSSKLASIAAENQFMKKFGIGDNSADEFAHGHAEEVVRVVEEAVHTQKQKREHTHTRT